MPTPADRLTRQQMRILVGVCVAVGVAYLQPATYNYMVTPMLTSFGAGETRAALLRETPSIASLLVIFPAAVLARRVGQRRMVSIGAILLMLGSLVVAVAHSLWVAAVGLAVQAVGGTALLVVPLGVLGASVTSPGARATAFSVFSMMSRVVFAFFPILTAVLMENGSWRVVATTWAAGGVIALLAVRWSLHSDAGDPGSGELLTPVLASLLCVAVAQWATHVTADGLLSMASSLRLGLCVAAAAALAVALRRVRRPSVDVEFFQRPGVPLMLIVVALWCFAQLWYYVTLALEFVFDYSVLQTALLMAPSQLCAVVGARSAGWIVRRFGLTASGFWLLLLTSAALAIGSLLSAGWPTWALVAVTCLYSFSALAAGVPMTTSIMDAATSGDESGASAARQAAIAVGNAIGVAMLSATMLVVFSNTFTARVTAVGIESAEADRIAQSIWSGLRQRDVSQMYSVSDRQVRVATTDEKESYLDGMSATGWTSAAVTVLAAGLFLASRRRLEVAGRKGLTA